MAMAIFADILVPVPVSGTFLYRIPPEIAEHPRPGIRVVVPFGRNKTYTGIIMAIHQEPPPADIIARDVLTVLDKTPLVTEKQFRFWKWISEYYLCTEGEVMDASLPAGLKPAYIQSLKIPLGNNTLFNALSKEENMILDFLRMTGSCTTDELVKHLGKKKLAGTVQQMISKGIIIAEDILDEKYKPRKVSVLTLTEDINTDSEWNSILDGLNRARRQQEILMFFLEKQAEKGKAPWIKKSLILKQFPSPSAVKTLIQKGYLRETTKEVSRLPIPVQPAVPLNRLNHSQRKTLEDIEHLMEEKEIVLLHGITSSGKTEIYFHLIKKVIQSGRQVLYLLPEIAITAQMIRRLQSVFGTKVAIYHSRYSENERVETWLETAKDLSNTDVRIILGVRSAIFLPFRDLGLIIIDEEHETTYKQQNPAPRYHARDMATVLARIYGAKVLLGTATPSIESYFNARTGKYGFAELKERFTRVALPAVRIIDMKKSFRRGEAKGHLSEPLFRAMVQALKDQEQIILFQNRRGFSPFIQCNHCGWIPYCRNCDVRLTYHRHENKLECHYCGYSEPLPHECPRCGNSDLRTRGFGTEKVEDEISLLFPEAKLLRLDLDTAHTRSSYEKIIRQFEEQRADILIGTQMITKGLDFKHVQVVGILNADNLLHYPDFRAWERSYQLLTQVSGRAGRQDKQGAVFIQTWDPEHPILQDVVSGNYFHMYQSQLEERKIFHYPPYYRLIRILLKHRKTDVVNRGAHLFAENLRKSFPGEVLGPEPPVIPRIRNLWEKQILLKINRESDLKVMKELITGTGDLLKNDKVLRSIRIMYDVDPV